MKMRNLVPLWLFLFTFALFFAGIPAAALELEKTPVNVITGDDAAPWAKVECLKDASDKFVSEPFHKNSAHSHHTIKKAFGTDRPHSGLFLLHYAPNWDKVSDKTPVLLVHGAGDNASRAWAHPFEFDTADGNNIKNPGLMQFLAGKGYPVFAITYSHPHGDNFLQAEQLANAILRIKEVLKGGENFKVDIICHSKGAMSTRIYLSSLGEDCDKYNWLTPFRKDVRKCIFIASPLKGIDTPYRYYAYNLTTVMKDLAAPVGPETMLYMGALISFKEFNEQFPGQPQMLHNWVEDGIPLSAQSFTADLNATAIALYHGGLSAFLTSKGIDAAIKQAGDVINKLNQKGIDPSIKASILAGTKQDIDSIKFGFWKIPIGEMAAPSDGVLFLKSATYKDGLMAQGATVESMKVLPRHHVGLTVWPEALNFIDGVLSKN